jgi:hypothetical protein
MGKEPSSVSILKESVERNSKVEKDSKMVV